MIDFRESNILSNDAACMSAWDEFWANDSIGKDEDLCADARWTMLNLQGDDRRRAMCKLMVKAVTNG